MLWKNGEPTVQSFIWGRALAVEVINNDVYVAGFGKNVTTNKNEAKFWKNGIETILINNGTNATVASDIKVVNNDVYVLINETVGLNNTIKVWKNGNIISITNNLRTYGNAFAINGNDIYVVGYEYLNNDKYGRIWKNTQVTALDKGEAKDIQIVNNDVYVVGYEINTNGT
ncbi:MAG: hypothetical protein HC854_15140 [Flavobacterium sp.]|nr:hypothetical protein [Flavobacterium sp.]